MPDPALKQIRQLKRRQQALLSRSEKKQLRRTQGLLHLVLRRHAELEDGDIVDSAHGANTKIGMLLSADDCERAAILGDVERLRMRGWLDAGAPGLEQALAARGDTTDV